MNDPLLGAVIGLLVASAFLIGHRLGSRAGFFEGQLKARRTEAKASRATAVNGHDEPKVRASWLRRNVFKPRIVKAQEDFDFGRIKIL